MLYMSPVQCQILKVLLSIFVEYTFFFWVTALALSSRLCTVRQSPCCGLMCAGCAGCHQSRADQVNIPPSVFWSPSTDHHLTWSRLLLMDRILLLRYSMAQLWIISYNYNIMYCAPARHRTIIMSLMFPDMSICHHDIIFSESIKYFVYFQEKY